MKTFDSIIFDLDGTLWDTCEACAVAWNNVIKRNNIDFKEIAASDVGGVTGKPHPECIKTVFSKLPDEIIQIITEETMDEDTLIIKELGGELYEGVTEGLDYLSKKYDLFIVSNCQSGYIENFLSANQLKDLFKDFTCWGDSGESKSKNTKNIIKKNNLASPVFVGDTDGDYEAAVSCSLAFIQVTYGFGSPIKGCKKVDSFSALVEYLN